MKWQKSIKDARDQCQAALDPQAPQDEMSRASYQRELQKKVGVKERGRRFDEMSQQAYHKKMNIVG